jgi:hypothetical protein
MRRLTRMKAERAAEEAVAEEAAVVTGVKHVVATVDQLVTNLGDRLGEGQRRAEAEGHDEGRRVEAGGPDWMLPPPALWALAQASIQHPNRSSWLSNRLPRSSGEHVKRGSGSATGALLASSCRCAVR